MIDENIQKIADKLKGVNSNIHTKLTPKSVRIDECRWVLEISEPIETVLSSQLELYKTNDKSCLNLMEQTEAQEFLTYVAGVVQTRIQGQNSLSNKDIALIVGYIGTLYYLAMTNPTLPCATSIDVLVELITANNCVRKQCRNEFDKLTHKRTFGYKNKTDKVKIR